MTIYQAYQHFHPKPVEIESLTHDEQVALSEKAYDLYISLREYVYVHGLHCERDATFGKKAAYRCQACTELRKAMDEA